MNTSAMPWVSIILPVHNGARYLDEAIGSCVAQTLRDWELIVVDDASTDATPELIQKWLARDDRITAVRNPVNRKLPASLNVGFARARGQYWTWTSDDNRYLPSALEEMAGILGSYADIDVVYGDELDIDEHGMAGARRCKGPPEELLSRNCINACFLFRAEVWRQLGGYDEKCFLAEDYDFWLRAYAQGHRFYGFRKPLYLYRQHAQSLSARHAGEVLRVSIGIRSRVLPQIRGLDRPTRARISYDLAGLAWQVGLRDELRHNIRQAVRYAPAVLLHREGWRYLFYGHCHPVVAGALRKFLTGCGLLSRNHKPTILAGKP